MKLISDIFIIFSILTAVYLLLTNNWKGLTSKASKNILLRSALIFLFAILTRWFLALIGFGFSKVGETWGIQDFFNHMFSYFTEQGDSPHYLRIAQYGYEASGEHAKLIVFYPLYPFFIKLFQLVFRDYVLSAVIVSNLAFGLTCVYFYHLVKLELGKRKAGWSLLYLVLFPFGVFYLLVMTESVFMLFTVMTIYYIRKGGWGWLVAGILSFFTTLSRTQGILVFLVYVVEAIVMLRKRYLREGSLHFKKIDLCLISGLLGPLGIFVYLLINKLVQNDWFVFMKHVSAAPWYQKSEWIGNNLYQNFDMGTQHLYLSVMMYFVQIVFFFCVLGLIVYGLYKKERISYLIYTLGYLFVTFTASWLLSGARYIMCCFPIYTTLARIDNKKAKVFVACLLGLMLGVYGLYMMQRHTIM